MDFELAYTAEQEEFRKEVRAWLDANIPADVEAEVPADEQAVTREQWEWAREFRRKLGAQGWLAPTYPKEFGGGGLTVAHAIVIDEELARRHVPSVGDSGLSLGAPALMAWGTDEQKERFLGPILRGEIVCWQVFTEPGAGSDLASLKTRATEDGDDYVVNGNKIFVGQKHWSDYLYTLTVTDPEAPRHNNISAFIIPTDTEGVTVHHLDLIAGGGKRAIFFDDARVPKENLIGGANGRGKGWWVAQTTLELEHGGGGRVVYRHQEELDGFVDYARNNIRNGQRISQDPRNREIIVNTYLEGRRGYLLGLRNYWQKNNGVRQTYEGSQLSLAGKLAMPFLATNMMEVLGPYALVNDKTYGPGRNGLIEAFQRGSTATHPGGTIEIQKVIMARTMGLSRGRG